MSDTWREALDAAIAGDPSVGVDSALLAVRAARARIALVPMPTLEEIARASNDPSAPLAAALVARHALVRLDAPGQRDAALLSARLTREGDERAAIESEIARAWSEHLAGAPIFEHARTLEARASRARIAHAVIDAACLTASAALVEQDLETATALARRASRMARTEGLPHEEYLAHVILARIRRHGGRPHLATRILTSIARVAPSAMRGWLALELLLSGAGDVARRVMARGHDGAAGADGVIALLDAAARGDRVSFDRARATVGRALGPLRPFGDEVEALVAALDPAAEPPPGLADFLSGVSASVPGVLSGIAGTTPVRVVAWADGRARRVLSLGVALAPSVLEIGREAGAKQHRREAALAQLAFAGAEGLANDELFRRVWGFQFTPHLHQSVLDVLLHRVRAALGDAGELVRREKRVRLQLERTIALVDPRVEPSLEDAVLNALALRGVARARELGDDLGVPLRTVQQALARLVEDEECARIGEGQAVTYRVDDTTFRETTRL